MIESLSLGLLMNLDISVNIRLSVQKRHASCEVKTRMETMRLKCFWLMMLLLMTVGCGDSGENNNKTTDGNDTESEVGNDKDSGTGDREILHLEAGDVASLVDAEGVVAVNGSGDNQSFVAVVYSGKFESERLISYTIEVEGALSGSGSTTTEQALSTSQLLPVFHRPPISLGDGPFTPRHPLPSPPPEIGEHRSFHVLDASFINTVEIDAECVKRTGEVAIWVDRTTTEPETDVDEDHIGELVAGLEATVLPRTQEIFGPLSDIDGDGLLHILYTSAFADSGVDSYISYCDIFNADGCPVSNEMEIIFTSPLNLLVDSMMQAVSGRLGIMAHELQHLIYSYQKIMMNRLYTTPDNPYAGEGLSAMAEDLSGYGNGNFFVWATSLQTVTDIGVADLVGTMSNRYADDPLIDTARRAMSYLFWRYLFEQSGGNVFEPDNELGDRGGIEFLRRFESSALLGQQGIEDLMGRPIEDLAFDWLTALAVSNRPRQGDVPFNDDPRFNYHPATSDPDTRSALGSKERHGVDLYSEMPMGQPALSGPPVVDWFNADGIVHASGADYLRIRPNTGSQLIKISVSSVEPDADLRVRLIKE